MKKVLLTLLVVIVAVGFLVGAGFAGYRIGYRQGALSTSTNTTSNNNNTPFMHGFQFGQKDMPMQNFGRDLDRNFNRGMRPGGFGVRGGMGFGFFPPLMFLGQILFWGLIILFAYWLFTKSGWQLTRTRQPVEAPKVEASTPEEKEA